MPRVSSGGLLVCYSTQNCGSNGAKHVLVTIYSRLHILFGYSDHTIVGSPSTKCLEQTLSLLHGFHSDLPLFILRKAAIHLFFYHHFSENLENSITYKVDPTSNHTLFLSVSHGWYMVLISTYIF